MSESRKKQYEYISRVTRCALVALNVWQDHMSCIYGGKYISAMPIIDKNKISLEILTMEILYAFNKVNYSFTYKY